jgi:hypothetical protein
MIFPIGIENKIKAQRGLTLLEVLVSLVLLMLMLLGFDAMQLSALRSAKSAYYLSVATQQVDVIVQRLSVLKELFNGDAIAEWNIENQTVLPNGLGRVDGQFPNYRISINWGRSGCLVLPVSL